jgi:hypothetical protein
MRHPYPLYSVYSYVFCGPYVLCSPYVFVLMNTVVINIDRLCGLMVTSSWLQILRSGFNSLRYQIF